MAIAQERHWHLALSLDVALMKELLKQESCPLLERAKLPSWSRNVTGMDQEIQALLLRLKLILFIFKVDKLVPIFLLSCDLFGPDSDVNVI